MPEASAKRKLIVIGASYLQLPLIRKARDLRLEVLDKKLLFRVKGYCPSGNEGQR